MKQCNRLASYNCMCSLATLLMNANRRPKLMIFIYILVFILFRNTHKMCMLIKFFVNLNGALDPNHQISETPHVQ